MQWAKFIPDETSNFREAARDRNTSFQIWLTVYSEISNNRNTGGKKHSKNIGRKRLKSIILRLENTSFQLAPYFCPVVCPLYSPKKENQPRFLQFKSVSQGIHTRGQECGWRDNLNSVLIINVWLCNLHELSSFSKGGGKKIEKLNILQTTAEASQSTPPWQGLASAHSHLHNV